MENKTSPWLQKPIHPALPAITNEIAIFAIIILLAIVTRFYDLETRVMSHDESLHTYYSWSLYRGIGYQHTPMMHGPYQFHVIALTYFLFGVSDFTARIPAVLFSIATVWMVWYWRRYLGKWGMLVAAFLMVVSPYMLYYGRYVRNESFVGFSGILLLYAMLRYIESGEKRYLYFVTAATLLHFTSKETAFIYTLLALLFLGFYFISKINYRVFVIAVTTTLLLTSIGTIFRYINQNVDAITLSGSETAPPANPTGTLPESEIQGKIKIPDSGIVMFGSAVFVVMIAMTFLLITEGWKRLCQYRSFDLMVLLGTFVLPMLIPLPIKLLEKALKVVIPTDAASVNGLDPRSLWIIGGFVAAFFAISIAVGLLWSRDWWKYGALYWSAFTILYTTVFTNAPGFFTGLIGSLGYWLVQQGVERGSQPEYFYWLIQIPMYEYLPALGSIVAIVLGLKKLFGQNPAAAESDAELMSEADVVIESSESKPESSESNFGVFFWLMTWWSIATIIAFTIAGEKMPWLTYHMAWPMILMTGWAVGQIIESVAERLTENKGQSILAMLVLAVFSLAAFHTIRTLFGATPPFQGTELIQLQATSAFIFPLITMILSGVLLAYLIKDDLASLGVIALFVLAIITLGSSIINGASFMMLSATEGIDPASLSPDRLKFLSAAVALIASIAGIVFVARLPRTSALVGLFTLTIFGLLTLQTVRTSFRANYINYNNATEYLVYAHGAGGVKDVMAQVEEISERTAGGYNAIVAYDREVSWPQVWYLRDYTNARLFDQPTRSLREAVAVIVDDKNFDKIEAALGDGFYRFDYMRMWWPNQDYFNLDKTRVLNAITNPDIRAGIFDIWFNRDYTRYAQATSNTSMTLTTWSPGDQMRLYVRKDVAAQIWSYGVGPSQAPSVSDPYEAGTVMLTADPIFGFERFAPLGLNAPRSIAAGLNDDLYIADSRNHRILHISSDGSLLHEWGSFGDILSGNLPTGTFFNEPWGIAVGPDGSVYVTDTWNHRVQKFSKDGRLIKTWGQYGQPVIEIPESASSLWGPRGIAVNSRGQVFVADTGNKRIVVFDKDGNYLTEFGTGGFEPGEFDEPVGVAVAPNGTVYVTDAWNQRIQAFVSNETGDFYIPTIQWDVNAWFGQSLDNKPLIAVGANEHVFITDPEGYRIIEFTSSGEFVRTWGDFGEGPEEIGLAAGIAVDQHGFVWVTDAGNNRILRYTLP